jgi:hypothetical protein
MKLSLQFQNSVSGTARAAFLSGENPGIWLETISSWGISPAALEAYVVPRSLSDLSVAGLLLIHRPGIFPTHLALREAYQCIADSLLIPSYAAIHPPVLPIEWKSLLHYDWHFYHPGIGMVGFNQSDQIQLADLLTYPAASPQEWRGANSGIQPPAMLREVSIKQPKVENLFLDIQEIGDRSIQDLLKQTPPEESQSSSLRLELLKEFERWLHQRPTVREGQAQGWLGKWLDSVQDRISQRIADLRQQREDEINRLLKLFEQNPDEALHYSIPLNSPYEGRGVATPGGILGRRDSVDYSARGLGQGKAIDNWSIDEARRAALHQHYLRVANEKVAAGDFRKAAYIHAHLLGDYYTAAKVLEQGKHYLDAAILYRDHLKNRQQAATCFELGGLYTEAIQLYLELGQREKAADLYHLLDRPAEAAKLYQACIEQALLRSDYLDAARLCEDKLGDEEQAKAILLRGWRSSPNPITCLNRYLAFFQDAEPAAFDQELQRIYTHEVLPAQRQDFIKVLEDIGKDASRRGKLPHTRAIVYTLISKELQAGQRNHLNLLNTFVPKDRLLAGDISKYIAQESDHAAAVRQRLRNWQRFRLAKKQVLPPNIEWYEARLLNHTLLVLGQKERELYLYCSDLNESQEVFPIGTARYAGEKPKIFAHPHHSAYFGLSVYAHLPEQLRIPGKYLGYDLQLLNQKMDQNALAICPVQRDKYVELCLDASGTAMLHYRNAQGEHLDSYLCINARGEPVYFPPLAFDSSLFMYHVASRFYLLIPGDDQLYQISNFGRVNSFPLEERGSKLCTWDGEKIGHVLTELETTWGYAYKYFRVNNSSVISFPNLFAKQPEPTHLFFMIDGLFMVRNDELSVYALPRNEIPRKRADFTLEGQALAIFQGEMSNQMGVLTTDGQVLFYDFMG